MNVQSDRDTWLRCDTLFTPYLRHRDCWLHIGGGKILEILPASATALPPAGPVMYEPGAIVAPGFIDIHVHGARGRDLMDGTQESIQIVAETLASHGTTSFLATTVSAPDTGTEVALRGLAEHSAKVADGACPIGIHMEGPYINPVCRGTHCARFLKPTDVLAFRRFVEIAGGKVRKITVAPEMDPDMQLIQEAVRIGIQISLGHSDATLELARAAVDAGATHATHTFNAMRPVHQMEPGILGLVMTDERVYAEVIADGVHVHPIALKLLIRMKGIDRILLVTDGLSSVDMPDGRYPLGNKSIVVEKGVCRDAEGRLAGGILTLDLAVRNLVQWLQVPLHEALTAASASPARSLRLGDKKGIIAPGADADLVFLDPDLHVLKTMVGGRVVYTR